MSFRVVQDDNPQRAVSVQNPMSLNDLMINQPRRLSTGAMPPRGVTFHPPAPQPMRSRLPRMAGLPPMPPVQQERRTSPPPPSRANDPLPDIEMNPEEMGYELLTNESKMKRADDMPSPSPASSSNNNHDNDDVWEDNNGGGSGGGDYIHPNERRDFERGHSDPGLPPQNDSVPRMPSMRRENSPPASYDGGGFQPPSFRSSGFPSVNKPYVNYQEEMEKKQKYLEGLDKYRRRGMKVAQFDVNSPFEDVEAEYNRHKRTVDVEASIQFSRKMLMACITGLEYLNSRYDPLGLKLDGWSESVIEDIHNYDDVFERLYDKYHTSVEMAPEFELLLMVAGSAFMYHLTNSMFKSSMPGMANPEMMKNVRRGVMGAMRGAFNGAGGGGGVGGMMSGMFGGGGGGGAAPQQQQQQAPARNAQGNGNRSAGPPAPQSGRSSGPRREMSGPSGNMDDLLNNLMDREPGEVSERLVNEIDDILNNPSDDDGPRTVNFQARAGPGGNPSMNRPIEI